VCGRACTTAALLVKSLAPGGPAEASGQIQVGDILLKVDGKEVNSTETASKLILGSFISRARRIRPRDIADIAGPRFTQPNICRSVPDFMVSLAHPPSLSPSLPPSPPASLCACVFVCACITGTKGSKITMVFKRFAQDKVDKFTVHLIRGTAARLNN